MDRCQCTGQLRADVERRVGREAATPRYLTEEVAAAIEGHDERVLGTARCRLQQRNEVTVQRHPAICLSLPSQRVGMRPRVRTTDLDRDRAAVARTPRVEDPSSTTRAEQPWPKVHARDSRNEDHVVECSLVVIKPYSRTYLS